MKPPRDEIDSVCCTLHNLGAQCAGNTQDGDVEWFARWLYGASNFGMGSVNTTHWSLSNEEFKALGLTPDRSWTKWRWETLPKKRREAWMKLARLCLYAMPHIAERIGHRFMEQSKALRINCKLTPRPTPTANSPVVKSTLRWLAMAFPKVHRLTCKSWHISFTTNSGLSRASSC